MQEGTRIAAPGSPARVRIESEASCAPQATLRKEHDHEAKSDRNPACRSRPRGERRLCRADGVLFRRERGADEQRSAGCAAGRYLQLESVTHENSGLTPA